MKTAEKIIENLTVNVLDTARLIQEAAEELGERAKGLEKRRIDTPAAAGATLRDCRAEAGRTHGIR